MMTIPGNKVRFPCEKRFPLSLTHTNYESEVAYSFEAIEMRDISGADFKFAKTLTLDFFGSGMVDLPPGGAKRVKNSRKMQMVFFVFYGRVEVSMGTPLKAFSIGKGGQWQVPRGKLFSSSLFITTRFFESNSAEAEWIIHSRFECVQTKHQEQTPFVGAGVSLYIS